MLELVSKYTKVSPEKAINECEIIFDDNTHTIGRPNSLRSSSFMFLNAVISTYNM